jgi:hypothetical protein
VGSSSGDATGYASADKFQLKSNQSVPPVGPVSEGSVSLSKSSSSFADGHTILRDNFTIHNKSGLRSSIFSANLHSLTKLMALHNITVPSQDLVMADCRNALILHFVTGSCVNVSPQTNPATVGCRHILQTLPTPKAVQHSLYTILSSVTAVELPTYSLIAIGKFVSFTVQRHDERKRRHLQHSFLKLAATVHNSPFDHIPLAQYFTGEMGAQGLRQKDAQNDNPTTKYKIMPSRRPKR